MKMTNFLAVVLVQSALLVCLTVSQPDGDVGMLYPVAHLIPGAVADTNGSQVNVGCTGAQPIPNVCRDLDPGTPGGATSFLVDGYIPTAFDFNSTTWARELMTVFHFGNDFVLSVNFDAARATRVELVVFNCPDWEIGAVEITVETVVTISENGTVRGVQTEIGNHTLQNTSCHSLLTFCLPLLPPGLASAATYTISFLTGSNFSWTHIAEIAFYEDSIECADPFPATPAPTEPSTSAVESSVPSPSSSASMTSVATGLPSEDTSTLSMTTAVPTSLDSAGMLPTATLVPLSTSTALGLVTSSTVTPTTVSSGGQMSSEATTESTDASMTSTTVSATPTMTPPPTSSVTDSTNPPQGTQSGVVIAVVIVSVIVLLIAIALTGLFCYTLGKRKQSKFHQVQTLQNVLIEDGMVALNALRPTTQESEYSTINPNIQKSGKIEPEYATIQGDGYAVIGNPLVSAKSDPHNKPDGPQQLSRMSVPISGELFTNPLYSEMKLLESNTTSRVLPPPPYTESELFSNPSVVILDGNEKPQEIVPSPYIQPVKFFPKQGVSEPSDVQFQPYGPIYTLPTAPAQNKPLEVTIQNIKLEKELGDGNFGKVFLAKTFGLTSKDLKFGSSEDDKSNASFLVAVKMLKAGASTANRAAFEKEYKFMSRLDHSNVIRILGICTSGDTPFIMMEYMEKGDLNQYLKKYTEIVDSAALLSDGKISASTLLNMCIQIASAMKYLAARNFVHRDLATRNCLVGSNTVIKIADFGMSRSLYESHYYVVQGRASMPVRWMATECFYGLFSTKSDIWAFGVTMWEIFSLAKYEPYSDITDKEVVEDAVKGEGRSILNKPEASPQEVYDVMLSCWAHKSANRTTFEEAFKNLDSVKAK